MHTSSNASIGRLTSHVAWIMFRHFDNLENESFPVRRDRWWQNLPLDVRIYRIRPSLHSCTVERVGHIQSPHIEGRDRYREKVSSVFVPIRLPLFFLQYLVNQIHPAQEHHYKDDERRLLNITRGVTERCRVAAKLHGISLDHPSEYLLLNHWHAQTKQPK